MAGPIDTVNQLVDAINRGDLERALAAYEPEAVLLVQPGQLARGSIQLREALAGFIALKPTLTSEAQEVIEGGNVALYMGRWNLRGKDPAGKPVAMAGESADVLRRHEDGRWLIALDNPWGAQVLASRR
jgi:ketosteroid isomerase-like protein